MMDPVFDRLRSGAPVDMRSKEYQAAIAELQRADRVLFHLNHTEPRTKEWLDLRQGCFTKSNSVFRVYSDDKEIARSVFLLRKH